MRSRHRSPAAVHIHTTDAPHHWEQGTVSQRQMCFDRVKSLLELAALILAAAMVVGSHQSPTVGYQQAPESADDPSVLAKFVTVVSPVDDAAFGRVINTALNLQNQASGEGRKAVLVLEILPGTSQFHQVHGLAKELLKSSKLSRVKTVAWIPETVTGNNVVLALACDEIVMHPDAELGDIGRGQALDRDEQQQILSLVERRHNPKLSPALVLGMMDPEKRVLKIKLQIGDGKNESESRVVTPEELKELRENQVEIVDVETVKEAGFAKTFSGRQARALDVLAVQTVDSRAELADLYSLPLEALREDPTASDDLRVRLIKVDDMIEPVLETFLERQIDRSLAAGTNLLIFEIDSHGGFLQTSTNLAHRIADLDPKQVRTVAYVPEKAHSGAAIVALGCDEIYMNPEATIGDAGPIEMKPGGQFQHAPQKILGPLVLTLKELAERKDRPPAIAMSMADRNLEVYEVKHRETGRVWFMTEEELHDSDGQWEKGRLVVESGADKLLTIQGARAHELKIAEPPVRDIDELKQQLGVPPGERLVPVGRTWVDTLVFLLNSGPAMFLLIVVGVACIYLELHFMTGLLGIISALCFALFFWSRVLGGTAGWLEIVLFMLGLVFIGLEVFVIPGFGVFGVSGGLLVISSLILASQTFFNLEPYKDFELMARTMGTLSLSLIAVVVFGAAMSRFLPHVPVFNQMILTPPGMADGEHPDEPQLSPEAVGGMRTARGSATLLGQQGVAVSVLRPAGKAMFGDSYVYIIFEDGTDLYWARSRVLEYLSQVAPSLPATPSPMPGCCTIRGLRTRQSSSPDIHFSTSPNSPRYSPWSVKKKRTVRSPAWRPTSSALFRSSRWVFES